MVRTAMAATNQVINRSSVIITENPNRSKTQQSNERELMGTSVSIYAHMKLMLKVVSLEKSVFKAVLLQPSRKNEAYYTITTKGVTDLA